MKNKIKFVLKLILFIIAVVLLVVGFGIIGVMGLVIWQESKSWGGLEPCKWLLFGGMGCVVAAMILDLMGLWHELWK